MSKGKSLNPAEIERATMTKSDFYQLLDQHAGPGTVFDIEVREDPDRVTLMVRTIKGEPDYPGTFTEHDIEPVDPSEPNMAWLDTMTKYVDWLLDWRRERRGKCQNHEAFSNAAG